LAKQAAASSTKGVVGNRGSTTPTPPNKRHSRPRIVQRYKACYRLEGPNRHCVYVFIHLPDLNGNAARLVTLIVEHIRSDLLPFRTLYTYLEKRDPLNSW
jgi:hypothetical protein